MIFLFSARPIPNRNRKYEHCSHLFRKRWEFCVSISFGIAEKRGVALRKKTSVHSRRGGLRRGENLRHFASCPALAPGGLRKPLGCAFPCNLDIIDTAPTFCKRGGSFVSPSHSGLRGREGLALRKNTPGHNRRDGPCRRKKPGALRAVPPLLRAVWESPWGLNFHEIRNIKHCSHLFSLRRGRE